MPRFPSVDIAEIYADHSPGLDVDVAVSHDDDDSEEGMKFKIGVLDSSRLWHWHLPTPFSVVAGYWPISEIGQTMASRSDWVCGATLQKVCSS